MVTAGFCDSFGREGGKQKKKNVSKLHEKWKSGEKKIRERLSTLRRRANEVFPRTLIGGRASTGVDEEHGRASCVWTTTERRLIKTNGRAAVPAHSARATRAHARIAAATRPSARPPASPSVRYWASVRAPARPLVCVDGGPSFSFFFV